MKSVLNCLGQVAPIAFLVIVCTVASTAHAITEKERDKLREQIRVEEIKRLALENERAKKTPIKKNGSIKTKGKSARKKGLTKI